MTVEELLRLSNKIIPALNECDNEALANTIWERITKNDPFTEADIKVYTEEYTEEN